MAARRDDNPPEEWEDKIPDVKSKKKDDRDGQLKPSYTVTDRRHWVDSVGGEEEVSSEELIRPPAYVQALEEELKQKDETLREYIAQYKAAKA